MPVNFDKQRKQYLARFTRHGERIYVGRYETEEAAEAALKQKQNEYKTHEKPVVNYKLELEETDTSLINKLIQRYKKRMLQRKHEKENLAKLERL